MTTNGAVAVIGHRLGRPILAEVATIVMPDTILRWPRQLIARKWTFAAPRPGRPGVQMEIRHLLVRMAKKIPSWGYAGIQGALRNLGHRVARSTVAKILKEQGIPPSRERPMIWRTFVRAHWRALFAADFFTTEVWTVRGLVTYYTTFVIRASARATRPRPRPSAAAARWTFELLPCRGVMTQAEFSDITPVRYEASDLPSTCCLTTYSAGFSSATATDRVSGDGTIMVLVYRLHESGSVELEPGLGWLAKSSQRRTPRRYASQVPEDDNADQAGRPQGPRSAFAFELGRAKTTGSLSPSSRIARFYLPARA